MRNSRTLGALVAMAGLLGLLTTACGGPGSALSTSNTFFAISTMDSPATTPSTTGPTTTPPATSHPAPGTTTPPPATSSTTTTTTDNDGTSTGSDGYPAPNANLIVGSTEHRDGGKHIALTFDDGPDPTWTPQVLALLAQYHAVATFCLIGEHVQAYPALVGAIVAGGNALCDHTMHHYENLPNRPAAVIQSEIADDQQAIQAAAPGAPIRYFRAPAGAFSKPGAAVSVQQVAVSLGMQPLAWSIDTVDWTKPGVPAIVAAVEKAGAHDVILMHDGGGDRSQTLAALRALLPWLVANGYQFDFPQ